MERQRHGGQIGNENVICLKFYCQQHKERDGKRENMCVREKEHTCIDIIYFSDNVSVLRAKIIPVERLSLKEEGVWLWRKLTYLSRKSVGLI